MRESFSSEPIYSELEEIKKRLEKLKGVIEKEKLPKDKERIIKNEIRNYIQECQKTPSFSAPVNLRDEVEEISKFERSQQVGALVSLVFEKGLTKALSVAFQLDNPAILDEFHDTLTDRYYQILLEKKILKSL